MKECGARFWAGSSSSLMRTAAELMDRLILRYPERYSRGQLRTLQRRVRQWRSVMAKQLVYASAENSEIYEERPVDIGPVGVN